jgi:phage terminase small subunit
MLTLKQEAFCQAYIQNGGNASEAYRSVYNATKSTDKSVNELASQLLKNVKVASRVAALRADIQKRHELTVDDILAELEEARQIELSASKPNTSSMVAASMGKAKVAGLIKDRQEVTGADGGPIQHSLAVKFVAP